MAAELATARDRLAAMQAEDVSVAAAFDLSYQDLTVGQQRLFRRLGLHPGTDIDAYAAAALDDTDLQATPRRLGELHDHNLIGEPARGRYRLHDLLREYARARAAAADDDAENQAAIGRLLDYYLHTAVTASRHTAWRTSIADSPQPGPASAWAPELRTEEEAMAWLGTERANLHACADYAATHGRLAHAVRIPVAMSGFLLTEGHWNEAVTLGQAALAAARAADDRQGQAWALTQLGIVQELTGGYPAATASLTQALQLSRDLGDRRGQSCALNQLGIVQWLTGDHPAATASLTQALQLSRDLGDRQGQAWALNQLSVVQRRTGDYPAATASLTQALQLFGDLGDRRGQAWALGDLGVVQRLTGDYPAATASLTQALQLSRDLGDRQGQACALTQLGVVQQLTEDHPAATASLTQALQLSRDLGDRHGQAVASINLGELLFLSSAHREARGYFAQALSIARDINAPVQEARALEGIARCHIQEGNPVQGDAHLQQALAIYRRIGAPEAQRIETALLNLARMTGKGGETSHQADREGHHKVHKGLTNMGPAFAMAAEALGPGSCFPPQGSS